METKLILIDTNIIIEVFKNNQNIIRTIHSIGIDRTAISCVTAMELYYGALNKADLKQTKKYIEAFENILIDQECLASPGIG